MLVPLVLFDRPYGKGIAIIAWSLFITYFGLAAVIARAANLMLVLHMLRQGLRIVHWTSIEHGSRCSVFDWIRPPSRNNQIVGAKNEL